MAVGVVTGSVRWHSEAGSRGARGWDIAYGGVFEVDQYHGTIWSQDDVFGVQVAESNAAIVQRVQRRANAVSNALRPLSVNAKIRLSCIKANERTAGDHGIYQCLALYVFLDKVVMFPNLG
jgi:hypothetical protein